MGVCGSQVRVTPSSPLAPSPILRPNPRGLVWLRSSEPLAADSPFSQDRLCALYERVAAAPLSECTALESRVIEVINLDVERTGIPIEVGSSGQDSLRRVLFATALYDVGVAYVQGMNFLAFFALQHLDWREDLAFTLLIRMLFSSQPPYRLSRLYFSDLEGTRELSQALDNLLPRCSQPLSKHLKTLGISTVLIFEWAFCLFTLVLPQDQCLPVWDALFEEGFHPLMHAVTLALLLHLEPQLLGQSAHETLMILKGYARARLSVGAGEDAGCFTTSIQPPADLLSKARGLIQTLRLPEGWGLGGNFPRIR